jgi:hypothetical protein
VLDVVQYLPRSLRWEVREAMLLWTPGLLGHVLSTSSADGFILDVTHDVVGLLDAEFASVPTVWRVVGSVDFGSLTLPQVRACLHAALGCQ